MADVRLHVVGEPTRSAITTPVSPSSAALVQTTPADQAAGMPTKVPHAVAVRARVAVSVLFLANSLSNVWLARLAEVQRDIQLSDVELGGCLATGAFGGLLGGPAAGWLIGKIGSGRTSMLFFMLMAAGMPVIGLARGPIELAAALLWLGATDSIMDAAQNAHGMRVQHAYGKSVLNSFHGFWSLGMVLGGLVGVVSASNGLPLVWMLVVVAAVCAAAVLLTYCWLLPGPDPESHLEHDDLDEQATALENGNDQGVARPSSERPSDQGASDGPVLVSAACGDVDVDQGNGNPSGVEHAQGDDHPNDVANAKRDETRTLTGHENVTNASPDLSASHKLQADSTSNPVDPPPACGIMRRGMVWGLSLFIMLAVIVELIPAQWSVIYLSSLGFDRKTEGIGYVVFQAAMTAGRFVGDFLIDKLTDVVWTRTAMGCTAVVMVVAVQWGQPIAYVVACAIAGFGTATLFPSCMRAAAHVPGVNPGVGVAMVSWLGRAGFIIAPLLVGAIGDSAGIGWGMALLPLCAALLFLLAGLLKPQK